MSKLKYDLTDQVFGHLKVKEYVGNQKWLCECFCGKENCLGETIVQSQHLRAGRTKSCGAKVAFKDLTGQKYNHWTLLKYLGNSMYECQCDCENKTIKPVHRYDLINSKSKSCGKCSGNQLKDIKGQMFGYWEALEYIGDQKWLCKCHCDNCDGIERIVDGRTLRNGMSTSCGTKPPLDLTNQKFGEWVAIKYMGKHKWLCECSCESKTQRIITSLRLRSGITKSCGCKKTENYITTMQEKYGICNISQLHLTEEQLEMTSSKDSLLNVINTNFDINPTPKQLSKLLGINPCQVMRVVRQYNLEDMVELNKGTSEYEDEIESLFSCENRNNREILEGKEIDLYYPDEQIGIEFNGDYWHSEQFRPTKYHQEKSMKALEKGVRIIHIFEHEWLNESTRVKLIDLLNKELNKDNLEKVYARDCVIKQVNAEDIKEFLEEYHLQGYATSSINLGCYDKNNRLLGLMTFGTPRFNKECEYELIRLCWLPNILVTGGSEKLFSHFIKHYNPESILTYCDISKFTGKVYERLGFKLEKITQPNYIWFNNRNYDIKSRYQTQKHHLVEQDLGTEDQTEAEIMNNLGYIRVYDCGNYRFIWRK